MAKSFYEFMLQYKGRNTPRGDLARDMIYMQIHHPEEGDLNELDSEYRFMCYLSAHRACDECCVVARRCWQSYRKMLQSVC